MSIQMPDRGSDEPRVVVGVDGSPSSIGALREAAVLAAALGADLDVVGVWSMPTSYGRWYGYLPQDWAPREDAERTVRDAVQAAFGEDVPDRLHSRLVQGRGSPASALIGAAEGARMLVVGSRGHGGFAGLLLGSVSSACAEYAQCPVLVYHGTVASEQAIE